ncbi:MULTISPECIES: hypothetical protein [unclassified Streptomyces]|uniref:hypothetical protein n=1 Tax=unclassified Streptomyces TaxID=2593676 RepID=UPI00081EA849|nr:MULTISPECIES: hypothetical protein [unclassified Streptomyces]MYR28642.1 hypothetical protein [Streptomyces sp. SID4945]SCF39944.1 hypothetical protein GA0115257_115411 [Streptomyces sp. LcepLS]
MTLLMNQGSALAAAQGLMAQHPLLPAAEVTLTKDGRVKVSVHDGFAAFEEWREALALDPVAVSWLGFGTGASLHASTTVDGVTVEVIGYSADVTQLVGQVA